MNEPARTHDKKREASRKNSIYMKQRTYLSQSTNPPVDRIMFFQRTIGNRAVQGLIRSRNLQAEPQKGRGAVKESVNMRQIQMQETIIRQNCKECDEVQKKDKEDEEEEKVCKSGMIQGNLVLGSPGDIYEQEADRVAEEVSNSRIFSIGKMQQEFISGVNVPEFLGLVESRGKEISSRDRDGARRVRISTDCGGSCPEDRTVSPSLESRILQSKGSGSALPLFIRKSMELQTGYDFSNVRVKTDSEASELNKSLGARAFTNGSDIWLGRNESVTDVKLMAHELTHVVQQGAAKRISPKSVSVSGIRSKSKVLGYLQAMLKGARSDSSVYHSDILQFRRENSPDKIMAIQQQILETPKFSINNKENSRTLRGCLGGCTPSRTPCKASATGVSLGPSTAVNNGTTWGMITPIIVRGSNLSQVEDSESVGSSIDHTGCFSTRPSAHSSNSGWMPADQIPPDNHTSGISDHLSYFDNHGGGTCSYSRLQLDLFKIPSCGINTPQPIPNSGYRLKREIKGEGGTKVRATITKTAEDVTVDGKSTTAGLTPKREESMIIRP